MRKTEEATDLPKQTCQSVGWNAKEPIACCINSEGIQGEINSILHRNETGLGAIYLTNEPQMSQFLCKCEYPC